MNRLRGLVALIVLAALVGGVPWLLLRYGEWPITEAPNREWLQRLTDTAMSDRAVFAVLTVAVWLVWAAFTFSVLVELAAELRGIQAPRVSVLGPLQRSARGLVATLVLALSINQSMTGVAFATPSPSAPVRGVPVAELIRVDRPAVTRASSSHPIVPRASLASADRASSHASDAVVRPGGTVVVARGDTAWSIAERHLGDGMRWRELWDLNHGATQPDGRAWTDPQKLLVGWTLQLPGPSSTTASAAEQPSEPASTNGAHSYTVVRGDTLSEIAEDELGDASKFRLIYDLSRETHQPGGRHLTDPNLILPGWKLTIPGDSAEPAPPLASSPETPAPSVDRITPEIPIPSTPAAIAPASTSSLPRAAATPTSAPPPVTVAVPTANPPALAIPSTWPAPAAPDTSETPVRSSRSIAFIAGLGGSLVLASGLCIRMMQLRRRRISRGLRGRGLVETNADVIKAVSRAADAPLVKWAGHELAHLVRRLDRKQVTGAPEAVELSEEAGIEILWDTEQPSAPEPWQAADGGWAWRLAYDPEAPIPAADLPASIPALVTIGTRSGRQLLLDLEAFGTIAVSGPDDRVEAFLRSIAIELAAGDDLSDAWVNAVGIDLPDEQFERLRISTIENAAIWLDSGARSIADAIKADGASNTFQARLGHPVPIEATIAIIGLDVGDVSAFLALPAAGGVAAVIAGDHETARCHIRIVNDGTARVEPLGIDFIAAALLPEACKVIEEILVELEELARCAPIEPSPTVSIDPEEVAEADEDDHLDEDDGPDALAEASPTLFPLDIERAGYGLPDCIRPRMLVKVLGVPRVPDRPELSRRQLITTVVLACHARPISADVIQDALYGEKGVKPKTLFNVIGSTRTVLGMFDDGTEVFPDIDRTKSKLSLAADVKTDLAVLRESIELARAMSTAEAIEILTAAHELIEGSPFSEDGFDWAHDEQFVDEATTLIEAATVDLVDRTLEAGLIDQARTTTRRAFRAVKCNEGLYRCRMKIEHAAGNPAGVRAALNELRACLSEYDAEPSSTTGELMTSLDVG